MCGCLQSLNITYGQRLYRLRSTKILLYTFYCLLYFIYYTIATLFNHNIYYTDYKVYCNVLYIDYTFYSSQVIVFHIKGHRELYNFGIHDCGSACVRVRQFGNKKRDKRSGFCCCRNRHWDVDCASEGIEEESLVREIM